MRNDDLIIAQVTTDQLVADTAANLRDDGQTDEELLDILTESIVKLYPAETAVNDAVKAIEALAKKRAEEPDDDSETHN